MTVSRKATTFQALWHGKPLSALHFAALGSFVDHGHDVHLYSYDRLEVPEGVVLRDAADVLPREAVFHFRNPQTETPDLGPFSDLFRFKLLRDRGGWYVDVDTFCMSSDIPPYLQAWTREAPESGSVGTGQIAMPRGGQLPTRLFEACLEASKSYGVREALGPYLITDTVHGLELPEDINGTPETFYPIPWIEIFKLWLPEFAPEMAERSSGAVFLPYYQSLPRYMGFLDHAPPAGSLLATLCCRHHKGGPPQEGIEASALRDMVSSWFTRNGAWAVREYRRVTGRDIFADLGPPAATTTVTLPPLPPGTGHVVAEPARDGMAARTEAPEVSDPVGRVAVVTATMGRPGAVQRLVRSIRARFPDLPIYVGDQSPPDPFMDDFYAGHGVTVVRTPHDSGVAHTRNETVAVVREDTFLLCDDDMIFTEDTDFGPALAILDGMPEVGVVGGRCRDITVEDDTQAIRNLFWELSFMYDPSAGSLVTLPAHMMSPEPIRVAGTMAFPCDSVVNFALFRRSVFDASVRWDPRFKCNGEHEDFYLNWKQDGRFKILYLPSLVADHHRPPQAGYGARRDRLEGWGLFMRKWGLSRHLEFGYGLRTVDDLGNVVGMRDMGASAPALAAMHVARLKYYFGDGAVAEADRTEPLPPPAEPTGLAGNDARVFIAYRREHVHGEDFMLYVRPEGCGSHDRSMTGMALTFSVRTGNRYAIHESPLELFRACPSWHEWNAYGLNLPDLDGHAVLEVTLRDRDGRRLAATGSFLCGPQRRFGADDDWIIGETRARGGEEASPSAWRSETFARVPSGELRLLTPAGTGPARITVPDRRSGQDDVLLLPRMPVGHARLLLP